MHELKLVHTDLKPENILALGGEYARLAPYAGGEGGDAGRCGLASWGGGARRGRLRPIPSARLFCRRRRGWGLCRRRPSVSRRADTARAAPSPPPKGRTAACRGCPRSG
jgi:hypothetical protein